MNGKGKPSTCYSDNPKMGKPYVPSGKGYQDGGKVLPASRMDGGVFVRAAQGAGLPTDNATLNQIVNLVNQGYDIARAAQMVKGGRAGRPEGYKDGGQVPEEEPMLTPEPEAPKPRVVEMGATELKPTKLGNKRDLFKYKKES